MRIQQDQIDEINGIKLVSMSFHFSHKSNYDIWTEFTNEFRYGHSNFLHFTDSLGEYLKEYLTGRWNIDYIKRSASQHVFMFKSQSDRDTAREELSKIIIAHKLSYVGPA